ncbi:hypothetical protein ACHAXA_000249 [Cyclostephanos tholiformis]|uniref:Uncharacterized protein n=1 Tax=Cyclostephanos tholiformis TaxID=382380 RepID=A0ABD3R7E2_9STRA
MVRPPSLAQLLPIALFVAAIAANATSPRTGTTDDGDDGGGDDASSSSSSSSSPPRQDQYHHLTIPTTTVANRRRRLSPTDGYEAHARLNDPKTVTVKEKFHSAFSSSSVRRGGPNIMEGVATVVPDALAHLRICNRMAPIPPELDASITKRYGHCPLMEGAPVETRLLLWEGTKTFGRTGNNLIEFLHGLQYARDNAMLPGIMMGSWATHLITDMWMAIRDDPANSRHSVERTNAVNEWRDVFEGAFCARVLTNDDDLTKYGEVIRMSTKEFFLFYRTDENLPTLDEYIEYQGHILRTLYRSYNTGHGVNMRNKPVRDMCSVIDATFGGEKSSSAKYSVIHSRSLEGEPGMRLLGRIARRSGCDPVAALDMEPDYIKAILEPLGMLQHPILFITDNQRPEILKKLLADPDIGRSIHLIPSDASWIGGDITAALMSDVFIGNPASTFSGFIAKSRVALGYDAKSTYMFRKKNKDGKWVDACDHRCIFDSEIMNAMA